MTEGTKELIKYRLDRAKETLDEAKVMMESGHVYGAANRVYYACFYSVTALLLNKGMSSSKHSGVMSLFNRNFVKPGLIQVEYGKFYARMFDTRLESDYGDIVEIEYADIAEDIKTAEQFVQTIIELV